MPTYSIRSSIFDPIRFTTSTDVSDFIVDTWFSHSIITQDLFTRLPGLPTLGTGRVIASSGMGMTRPRVEIGVQINNLRALPITAYVMDSGPSDLLLGSDFLRLLFDMGLEKPIDAPLATIEPPTKRAKTSLALRLLSESESFAVTDLERFIGALRSIHNCAVVVERGMPQQGDWPENETGTVLADAVRLTVTRDANLSGQDRLTVTWVESGSIWITLKSGAKTGLTWLSQIFKQTMDAKLEKTIAEATSAHEKAKIAEMTREDIAQAKKAEARFKTAAAVRKARAEWHDMVLGEIDFKKALCERVKDDRLKEELSKQLETAIADMANTKLLAMVEHLPDLPETEHLRLPLRKRWDEDHNQRHDRKG